MDVTGTVGNSDMVSWARDDGNGSLSLCDSCTCPLFAKLMKEGNEPDATSYVSIIHHMQKKVHVLQQALLASNQCSSLLDVIKRAGKQSMTEVSPKKVRVSKEGCGAQGECCEHSPVMDANEAMMSLRHAASKVHMEDINAWTREASLDLLNGFHTSSDDASVARINNEKMVVASPPCSSGDGHMRASQKPNFSVDPIIVIDITSTMNQTRQCAPMTPGSEDVLEVKKSAKEMEDLSAENARLREELAATQRFLDVRNEEVRSQKIKLEELSTSVERLQECNARLEKNCAAAHSQCDATAKTARIAEAKLKETTTTLESLEFRCREVERECAEAKRDADAAWREVRRLEAEVRPWEQKERELRRLRLLMRFSELKKDSDRLSAIAEQMEHVGNERDRLLEENRRCRALLEEYRGRLDAATARPAVPAANNSAPESTAQKDTAPPSPSSPQAADKPRTAGPVPHRPRVPTSITGTAGKTGEGTVPCGRRHRRSSEKRPGSLFVYTPKRWNMCSFFERKENESKLRQKQQPPVAAGRSRSCDKRPLTSLTDDFCLLRNKGFNVY